MARHINLAGLNNPNINRIQAGQTPGINDANLARQFATDNAFNNPALQGRLTGGIKPTQQQIQQPVAQLGQIQQQIPQSALAQPRQQFGLSGAEQAIRSGALGGVNAVSQGQNNALGTLQFGNQFAQNQLQQGLGALQSGAQGGLNQLQQGQQALGGNFGAQASSVNTATGQPMFQQAAGGVNQFTGAGLQAQGLQSALSGAQGQQAFDNAFINSPIQDFLRKEGERSVINQASATGGTGGGEVLRELTQFGQGLAGTQLQQQIANLQNLSGQGLQAAGQAGQFLSQGGQTQANLAAQNAQMATQANLASASNRLNAANSQANLFGQGASLLGRAASQGAGLFGQGAGIGSQLASQGAGMQFNTGNNIANLLSGAGNNIAQNRFQTGRDLASQIGRSSSALSGLANQQGSGLSDLIGQGGSNLANLISGSGQFDANQQSQLAQLLANISTGTGSQLANQQIGIGNAQAAGRTATSNALGSLIGQGVGLTAALGGFGGASAPTGGFTLPAFNPNDTSIGSLFP